MERYARADGADRWQIGNGMFSLEVAVRDGVPVVARARLAAAGGRSAEEWIGGPIAPRLEVRDASGTAAALPLAFRGAGIAASMPVAGRGVERVDAPVLVLKFSGPDGIEARHHLCASPALPVFRSWTVVENRSTTARPGLVRFDAMSLALAAGPAEPQAAYVLGWLDGPRVHAPGRPPAPHRYPSWIPRLLYGDGAPTPPSPPPAWTAAPLRLVRERLTALPLRSGKRSTYDDYPWVTVRDPAGRGFFAGFEWSGMWKADVVHDQVASLVSLFFSSDGNEHALAPGAVLESPGAFLGLFSGDWDDGFNACRRFVRQEIVPELPPGIPDAHFGVMPVGRTSTNDRRQWKAQVDAARDAGIDSFLVDAGWWQEGMQSLQDDFSVGLGFFEQNPATFPDGLRSLSDYVHASGMKFGLWFEFERVDVRTAGRGRMPWSPSWLLHRGGHAYRSWCQHVFLFCLGSREASDWATENIARAIEEYRVDWMKIDGNEYAFCEDASHGHAERDGDWHQTLGLYRVMDGVMGRSPGLIVENCAGGSQRADFGMARRSHVLQTNDIMWPSSLVRQYSHGLGAMYPTSYGMMALPAYPEGGSPPAQELPDGVGCPPEHLEWRCLCRLMGIFHPNLEFWRMGEPHLAVMRKVIATSKAVLPTLHGDRYVIAGPAELAAPRLAESDRWEVYEHLSVDESVVSVFFYRCLSPEREFRARLRGLDPGARYRGVSHTGDNDGAWTGAELMERGLACRVDRMPGADVVLLRRES